LQDPLNEGNIPGFLFVALRSDLMASAPEQRPAILAKFQTLKTRADAQQYLDEVRTKKSAIRVGPSVPP
jgi:hypothetical protein